MATVDAHITGTVWTVEVAVGDSIEEGDVVAVLESMKMEMPVETPHAGKVSALWPETRFTIGVHPHQAHQFADDPERAVAVVREQSAATPSARAVGEIGLDYHYDFSPRDV